MALSWPIFSSDDIMRQMPTEVECSKLLIIRGESLRHKHMRNLVVF